jgi:hypothetical protein
MMIHLMSLICVLSSSELLILFAAFATHEGDSQHKAIQNFILVHPLQITAVNVSGGAPAIGKTYVTLKVLYLSEIVQLQCHRLRWNTLYKKVWLISTICSE